VGAAGKTRLPAARGIRSRAVSAVDLLVVVCVLASVVSPWTTGVPPAHLAQSFGFQTAACWLAVLALVAALVLEARAAVIALAVVELVLIAWFGWAMWIVTTPRFSDLGFPFVGTDLIGPGWYLIAVGLLLAGGAVVRDLNDSHVPAGADLWILAAIPGFGLIRLGQWSRGLILATLFSAALYFASTDSPDPTQFAEYGRYGNVPPPYPRSVEWALLAIAALLWAITIALTIRERHRPVSSHPR
jgi:hypothetical protein